MAKEHVLEGHQCLADQLPERLRFPQLAQILPVRFSFGQANDLPLVELYELMAEQVNHGAAVIARLIELTGLIEQGAVRAGEGMGQGIKPLGLADHQRFALAACPQFAHPRGAHKHDNQGCRYPREHGHRAPEDQAI